MKYYFINKEIYYQNKKMPDRKEELFDVEIHNSKISARDKLGNYYTLNRSEFIVEEE